jgi:hypothetical protein
MQKLAKLGIGTKLFYSEDYTSGNTHAHQETGTPFIGSVGNG